MTKRRNIITTLLALVLTLGMAGRAHAVSDGAGNEVFPTFNVGVGTIAPTAQLNVKNDASVPFQVTNTAPGDYMVVTSAGRVGIGTTSPRQSLDVAGSLHFTGSFFVASDGAKSFFIDRYSTNAFSDELAIRKSRGTQVAPVVVINNDELGGLEFHGYDGSAFRSASMIRGYADGAVSSGNLPGRLSFFVNSGSQAGYGFEAMRINSTGNVGIGSTVPLSKLDVTGGAARILSGTASPNVGYATSAGSLYIQNDLEIDGNVYLGDVITDSLTVAGTMTLAGATNYTGNVGLSSATPTAQLDLKNNGTVPFQVTNNTAGDYVTVTSSGNVGIGRNAPVRKLDVAGNIQSFSATGTDKYIIAGTNRVYGDFSYSGLRYDRANDVAKWGYYYTSNAQGVTPEEWGYIAMKGSGNVGIGTIAPLATLDIAAKTNAPALMISSNNGNSTHGDYLTVTSTGYVGIGTTNPATTLDVTGIISADSINGNGSFDIYSEYTNRGRINLSSANANASSIQIALMTDGAQSLIVNKSGNVGIGSTTPLSKLDVTGGAARILSGTASPNVGYATSAGSLYIQNDLEIDGNVYLGDVITDSLTVAGTMTLAGATNYTGNVGLSSATPTAQLDLKNNGTVPFQVTNTVAGDYMVVTSAGNVGIGTTVPLQKLEVASDDSGHRGIRIKNTNSSGYAMLQLDRPSNIRGSVINYSTAGTADWYTGTLYNGGSASTAYSISTDHTITNSKLMISSAGNVGIGTTTPVAKLDISSANGIFLRAIDSVKGSNFNFNTDSDGRAFLVVEGKGGVHSGAYFTATGKQETWFDVKTSDNSADKHWVRFGNKSNKFAMQSLNDAATVAKEPFAIEIGAPNASFYIKESGNVGIGTTAPLAKFDIGVGTTGPALMISSNNGNSTHGDYVTVTSSGNVGIGTVSPGSKLTILGGDIALREDDDENNAITLTAGNSSGQINLFSGVNQQIQINSYPSGVSYFNSGNVGIGTTSPGAPLEIYRNGSGTNETGGGISLLRYFSGGNVRGGAIYSRSTDIGDNLFFGVTGGNGKHPYADLDQVRMAIHSSGNVGIGSTTPLSKLDVTGGAARILSGTASPSVAYATSAGSLYIQNDLEIDGNVYLGDVITDSLTVAGTMTLAGATNYTGNVGLSSATATAQLDIKNNNTVPFKITNAAEGDYMVVTSAGCVGVGVASPATKLDVSLGTGTGDIAYFRGSTAAGVRLKIAVDGSNSEILTQNGNNLRLGTAAANPALTILSAGNVGIGTTVPGQRLSVRTNVSGDQTAAGFFSYGGTDNEEVSLALGYAPSGANAVVLGHHFKMGASTDYGYLELYQGTRALVWNGSGNVGIGTTVPQETLTIKSTPSDILSLEGGGIGAAARFVLNTNYNGTANYLGIRSAASSFIPQIVFLSTGNVGIGTTNPAAPLAFSNTAGTKILLYENEGDKYGFGRESGGELNVFTGLNGNIKLRDGGPSGDVNMMITSSGNVGIGSTAPLSRLDVTGGAARILSGTASPNVAYATSAGSLYIQNDLEIDGNVYLGDVITDSLTVAGTMTLAGATNYTGNVGLSSATPTAQLDLKNNGTVPFQITNAAAGDYMVVTSAGCVGIGTTNPYSKLEVTASSVSWGEGIVINPSPTGYSSIFFRKTGNTGSNYTGTWFFGKDNLDNFGIYKNGLTGMVGTVNAWNTFSTTPTGNSLFGGNVGIGTAAPGKLLDVAGNIRATGNVGIGTAIEDSAGTPRILITTTAVEIDLQ